MVILSFALLYFVPKAQALPTWSPNIVNEINHYATAKEAVCGVGDADKKSGLCKAFTSDLAALGKPNKIKLVIYGEGKITLKKDTRLIFLERTESPFKFLINKRTVDLSTFSGPKELRTGIEAAMPGGTSASVILLEQEAFAAQSDAQASSVIEALLIKTIVSETCATFNELVKQCVFGAQEILSEVQRETSKLDTSKYPSIGRMLSLAQKLMTLTSKVDANVAAAFEADPKHCKTVATPDPDAEAAKCEDGLTQLAQKTTGVSDEQKQKSIDAILSAKQAIDSFRALKGSTAAAPAGQSQAPRAQ